MRRLRRLQALQHLDVPIVLLIGGATGTGKSTIATEAAHRLGITRVTSTDFIRQTMRAFFSQEFMPSVHYSSFEAGLALTKAEEEETGDPRLLGFLDQTRNVLVGVEAALDRALAEGWSMVLEGVHLVPGMIATRRDDAIVVQCIISIDDEQVHRSNFWVRDSATDGLRPLEKYLDGMHEIRLIQEALLERAGRFDVPVIENVTLDQAIGEVLDLVLSRADTLVARRVEPLGRRYDHPMVTRDDVVEALHGVEDPELGMDIVELGLFYEAEIEGPSIKVIHSLTSMGCPAGPMIQEMIHDAVAALPASRRSRSSSRSTPRGHPTSCPRMPSSSSVLASRACRRCGACRRSSPGSRGRSCRTARRLPGARARRRSRESGKTLSTCTRARPLRMSRRRRGSPRACPSSSRAA